MNMKRPLAFLLAAGMTLGLAACGGSGGTSGSGSSGSSGSADGSAVTLDLWAFNIGGFTFQPGETEKTAPVETRRNTNVTGDRDFTIELSTQEKGLILGFDTVATVTIRDRDSVEKEELQALVDEVRNLPESWFVSGWEDFAQALEAAEAVLQAESPAQSEIADAYFALLEARDLLVEREQYTQDDPFYLPDQGGVTLTLEAEFAELHNVELPSDGQWALQVAKAGWASHGEYINCLNQEDSISFPYVAERTGNVSAAKRVSIACSSAAGSSV